MEDSVTRVSYRRNPSLLQRFCGSLGGLLIGLLLLLGGCALLFWNEGRAVATQRALDEGRRMVRPLTLTGEKASLGHDDERQPLVHLTGALRTSRPVQDAHFRVTVWAVALRRTVHMFQWVEHRETREVNEGGHTRTETRFSYSKEWRAEVVDSRSFEKIHPNPREMPIAGKEYRAHQVKVRGLILSDTLIAKINNYRPLHAKQTPHGFQRHGDFLYRGRDPYNPEIGDVRVKFEVAGVSEDNADMVSIVAGKDGDRLRTFYASNGNEIEFLYVGELSAETIFAKEMAANTALTWGLRLAGWLLLFVALSAMTQPVRVLVDWIPLVRELVGFGLGTFNFFLSSSLAVTVIALGWIRYRPLLGWALVLLGASPYVLAWLRRARGDSGPHRD